jgi:hypothetical protein
MQNSLVSPFYFRKWAFYALFLFLTSSCHVMFIGAYDQVTDEGIQKIQVDITTVITSLETNLINDEPAKNDFPGFSDTYNRINGEVESLKIRCNALPKYNIVYQQVVALDSSVHAFENLHKSYGFNKTGQTAEQKQVSLKILGDTQILFETSFSAMISLQNGLKRQTNKN